MDVSLRINIEISNHIWKKKIMEISNPVMLHYTSVIYLELRCADTESIHFKTHLQRTLLHSINLSL